MGNVLVMRRPRVQIPEVALMECSRSNTNANAISLYKRCNYYLMREFFEAKLSNRPKLILESRHCYNNLAHVSIFFHVFKRLQRASPWKDRVYYWFEFFRGDGIS